MKRSLLVFGLLAASGCMVSNALQYEAVSETNIYHLARVRKGMSQRQVLCIMHKPYSYETFEVEDDIYDVWFYVTRPTGLDQTRMVPQNLTPLTFKNGVLVGTGYNYYYYAMKEQASGMAAQMPKVAEPKSPQMENNEFEKTLKAIPQQKAPQPQQQQPTPEKAPQNENLPPNVHIIGKNEIEYVPEDENSPCPTKCTPICGPCESPCGPCPEKLCGPNRFSVLTMGMTETQVFHVFGKPMKHVAFEICQDIYDAWFYDTIPSKTGKPSNIPQHQTILTFKNAVLISMDDERFFDLQKMAESHQVAKVAEVEELTLLPRPSGPPRNPKERLSVFKQYQHKGSPLGVTSTEKLAGLKKGMTETEVMKKIGISADQDTFVIGDDVYHVWFYDVQSKQTAEKIPLTFKNGKLVGTTMEEYNALKPQVCEDCYDEKGERMQEDADEQNFNYW